MEVHHYRPSMPLAAYVECFWYRQGRAPDRQPERALPTGNADLTFNLRDDCIRVFADDCDTIGRTTRGALVHGPQSRYFVLDARRNVHVIGVHFRAGGAAAALGVPAHELADRHVALEDLWGASAVRLRERLLELRNVRCMFAMLEAHLTRRLRPMLVHPAISFALRDIVASRGGARVADLQRSVGYGARRFTQLFASGVGLPPKLYSRIQRVRSIVEASANTGMSWAELAGEHGYYDQPHLIHDFRAFSGVTPADYRPLPGRALHMEITRADRG